MNSVVSANVVHLWTTYMRQLWWVMGSHHPRKAPKAAGLAPFLGGDWEVASLGSGSQDKLLPLPPSGRAHLFPVTSEGNLGEPSIQLNWWNQVAQVDWDEYLFFFSLLRLCSSPWRADGEVSVSEDQSWTSVSRKEGMNLIIWPWPPSRWYHSVLFYCCSSKCLKREKEKSSGNGRFNYEAHQSHVRCTGGLWYAVTCLLGTRDLLRQLDGLPARSQQLWSVLVPVTCESVGAIL